MYWICTDHRLDIAIRSGVMSAGIYRLEALVFTDLVHLTLQVFNIGRLQFDWLIK